MHHNSHKKNIKLQNNYINDWVSVIIVQQIIRIILSEESCATEDNGSLIILNITVFLCMFSI